MIYAWVKKWVWDIPVEQSAIKREQKSIRAEQFDVALEQSRVSLDMVKDGFSDEILARETVLNGRIALLNERIGNLTVRIGDLNELIFRGDRRGIGLDGSINGRMPGE